MEPNLKPLSRLLENESLKQLMAFDCENARLIVDLVCLKLADFLNFQETFQIFSDGESFLLFYYPFPLYNSAELDEPDEEEDNAIYKRFYCLNEITDILNEILKTYNEENLPGRYSGNFSGELEEWMVLRPRFVDHAYKDFFLDSIREHLKSLNVQKDLSKAERKLIKNWLAIGDVEGSYYRFI